MSKVFERKCGVVLFSVLLCTVSLYAQGLKYPSLSESRVIMVGDSGKWDANKVHTLSVVEANKGGYKYWGYYGLSNYFYFGHGNLNLLQAGLARSNDLVHWHKYRGNPIIRSDCRWPTVVLVGSRFYIFYAEYDSVTNDSRIVMSTSGDGIHFNNKTVVVPMEKGLQNQNPFIYFDKRDHDFCLVYYHGMEKNPDSTKDFWDIMIRRSRDINRLKYAKPTMLLSLSHTTAAPSVTFFRNKYYLLIETKKAGKWDNRWVTLAYASNRIGGNYEELDNSPVFTDNDACAFQYVFHNRLYIFYSHCIDMKKSDWELKMVKTVQ